MGRIGATLIFAILAASVGREFVDSVAQAAADSELRSWLVAVYHLLKLGVALAFTVFVLTRGPSRRPSREPVAFAACAVAILSVVMMEPPAESAGTALVLAGESLAVIGCAGMLLAVLALGRCFGVLPEARGLVTHGPYEFVRHPLYLGEFGGVAGLAIASPSLRNIVGVAAFTVAQLVRMRLEERALTREFPGYRDYAARTPRIVPSPRRVLAAARLRAARLTGGEPGHSPVPAGAPDSGQTLVEYAMILSLVALVCVGALSGFGTAVLNLMQSVTGAF